MHDHLPPLDLAAFHAATRPYLECARSLTPFEEIVTYCTQLFGTPRAAIGLMDDRRYVLLTALRSTLSWMPRDIALARYAVDGRSVFVIENALDSPFADHPLVVGGGRIRFYAAAPLILATDDCVGALSISDTRPLRFTREDRGRLLDLAHLVVFELEHPQPYVAPPRMKSAA